MIQCKSVYDPASTEDGRRILVDRCWPENCPEDSLQLHDWLPDVAPSADLHKAFMTMEMDFARFTAGYRQELGAHPAHWWALLSFAETATLTLVFAARDALQNHAVVLAQWLEDEFDRNGGSSSPVCYRDEFPDY